MRGTKPCWQCEHFGGWKLQRYTARAGEYAIALCTDPRGVRVIAEPQFGCVYWSRMPGSDDEPGCIDPAGQRHTPGLLRS